MAQAAARFRHVSNLKKKLTIDIGFLCCTVTCCPNVLKETCLKTTKKKRQVSKGELGKAPSKDFLESKYSAWNRLLITLGL